MQVQLLQLLLGDSATKSNKSKHAHASTHADVSFPDNAFPTLQNHKKKGF